MWNRPSPPPPPPPASDLVTPLIVSTVCILLPLLAVLRSRANKLASKKAAVTATGAEVPRDVARRLEAESADASNGVDRPLQMLCISLLVVPQAWVFATQENPTAVEQLSAWGSVTYGQLTDGKITFSFQLACALLFIERMCYTWVHSFSKSFVAFTKTAVGRQLGKKPLDCVLTIFYINKVARPPCHGPANAHHPGASRFLSALPRPVRRSSK